MADEQGVVGFQIGLAVGDVRHERLVKKLEESTKNASTCGGAGRCPSDEEIVIPRPRPGGSVWMSVAEVLVCLFGDLEPALDCCRARPWGCFCRQTPASAGCSIDTCICVYLHVQPLLANALCMPCHAFHLTRRSCIFPYRPLYPASSRYTRHVLRDGDRERKAVRASHLTRQQV